MNKKNTELKSTLQFTVCFSVVLILGMLSNLIFNNDTYSISLIISYLLKVIPLILTCMLVDDLYRFSTSRKDKLLIEGFLIVLSSVFSISYDFNLTSTILFLMIISYNFLLITSLFVKKR